MELGWMGGFCQGFKAMTSLKCDWSDAVTVGEPSRMMSVLSIFSLQSVEQTVEEWGGGAKLTGNGFTQQQVCVLQSCTKRKKQRASSSSSYFSHLCSQQQMLCVGVSVCVHVCVTVPVSLYVCVCVSLSVGVCVLWFFFFFLALVQTPRTAPSSVSTQSLLCCPYLLSSCIIPSLFSLLISFPSCSSLSPWFLFFILSLLFFLLFLLSTFLLLLFCFPPHLLFISLSSSSFVWFCDHFFSPSLISLYLSSPLHSFIFSFLPSFPPPPSPLHHLLLLIGIEVEHCIVGSWRWGVVVNFLVSGNRSSPVHCGKEAMVLRGGSRSILCLLPLIPAEGSPASKPLPLIFFFFSRSKMGLESHCRTSDSSSSSSSSASSSSCSLSSLLTVLICFFCISIELRASGGHSVKFKQFVNFEFNRRRFNTRLYDLTKQEITSTSKHAKLFKPRKWSKPNNWSRNDKSGLKFNGNLGTQLNQVHRATERLQTSRRSNSVKRNSSWQCCGSVDVRQCSVWWTGIRLPVRQRWR